MAVEKEEAFEHAHSDLPLSLGRCLFSYEASIANSCCVLHFMSHGKFARLKVILEEIFPLFFTGVVKGRERHPWEQGK